MIPEVHVDLRLGPGNLTLVFWEAVSETFKERGTNVAGIPDVVSWHHFHASVQ